MIKKSLALIMAALIATSFTACSGGSNEESSIESTSNTQSAAASEGSAASETVSDASESSESSSSSSISDLGVPEGSGPILKTALQDFMNSMDADKYLLQYSLEYYTSDTNGEAVSGVNTVKRSGDKMSSLMKADGYDSNLQIVKDNKVYEIDDSEKTVTWTSVEDGLIESFTLYTAGIFYINSLELCGSGKETINGKEYDYEEYKEPESTSSAESSTEASATSSTESSETSQEESVERARYYFENGKLVGLKHISGEYYYTTMILELSQNVSDSDFDYPSDYKLIDSSEVSEESSTSSTASTASSN